MNRQQIFWLNLKEGVQKLTGYDEKREWPAAAIGALFVFCLAVLVLVSFLTNPEGEILDATGEEVMREEGRL